MSRGRAVAALLDVPGAAKPQRPPQSRSLDVYEFENLVMKLVGRKNDDARIKALKVVEELGYTEKEELQLSGLFFMLDERQTKSLGVTAIRAIADRLHLEMRPEALWGLLQEFSTDSSAAEVDFAGFLRLFRQLAPHGPGIALRQIFALGD
ncbi:unnamed protein product [Prorocentrum cordatum]|uniref:Calmodulin n=1 Tax=Prorocentrum cordatum TaxID=2364126 RepID=A0ABN9QLP3_9DINO|nr:unnamed protein product [Polarella glacialis]